MPSATASALPTSNPTANAEPPAAVIACTVSSAAAVCVA
jgi:hypothetical protein